MLLLFCTLVLVCVVQINSFDHILIYGKFTGQYDSLSGIIGLYGPSNNGDLVQIYPPLSANSSYVIKPSGELNTWYIYTSENLNEYIVRITSNSYPIKPSGTSFFKVVSIGDNKFSYNLITGIFVRSLQEPVYSTFGGAAYTVMNYSVGLVEANLVCKALDGAIASPFSGQAQHFLTSISPPNSTYWTGIYQNNSNPNLPLWNYHSNDGKGKDFSFQYDGIDSQSGCLIIDFDQIFVTSSCVIEHHFICQTKQYHSYKGSWIRINEHLHNYDDAKHICASEGNVLWWNDYSTFLSNLASTFGYQGGYWTGLKWDAEESDYTTSTGYKVTDSSLIQWDPQRPQKDNCVILNENHYLETADCSKMYGFLCGYEVEGDVSASFPYQNKWSWASNSQHTYDNALNNCHENDHELFTIADYSAYFLLTEKLYYSPLSKYWIDLDNETVITSNHFLSFNQLSPSKPPEGFCPQLVVDKVSYVHYTNCSDKASTICKHNDFLGLAPATATKYFCPGNFELVGSSTCYGRPNMVAYWTRAKRICSTWGGLAGLYSHDSDYGWKNGMLAAYMQREGISSTWTDICNQGNVSTWTSDLHEGKLAYNGTSPHLGSCIVYTINTLKIPPVFIANSTLWNKRSPYVCEAQARTEEWEGDISFSTVYDDTLDISGPTYCQYTWAYQASNRQCVGLKILKFAWRETKCKADLFTFKTLDDFHFMGEIMKTFKWIADDRIWIGLCYTQSQGLRWSDGTSAEEVYKPWAVESKYEQDFCVAVDVDLYWHAMPCDTELMAWCTGPQCYKNSPEKYAGDINVTRSGLPCQNWLLQTPHKHDYDVTEQDNSYCRAFDDNYFAPYCLTTDVNMRLESCDIRICSAEYSSIYQVHTDGLDESDISHYTSEWLSTDTVMPCKENQLLMDCKCSNEHCYGAKSYLEETNNFGADSCWFYFENEDGSSDVMTKGNIYCKNLAEYTMTTRTLIESDFNIASVECPLIMDLVGCFSVETNNSLQRYSPDFGVGRIEERKCYPTLVTNTSIATTVCLKTSNKTTVLAGTKTDFANKVVSFTDSGIDSYIAINSGANDFNTLCVWVKVKRLGTLIYAAQNGNSPFFSVSESDQEGVGIFVTAINSIPFSLDKFSEERWQMLCIRPGVEGESKKCKLSINGYFVADSPDWCFTGDFEGHIILGSGNVFLPEVTYQNDSTTLLSHDTEATIDGQSAELSRQFVGEIGPIYLYRSRLLYADLKSLPFQCSGEINEESTLDLSNDVYLSGNYTVHTAEHPCHEYAAKYLLNVELDITEPEHGTLDFDIDVIPNSYESLMEIDSTRARLYLEYSLEGESEFRTEIGNETFTITPESQQFHFQVTKLAPGAVYETRLVISVEGSVLKENSAGITTIEVFQATAPSAVRNLRSDESVEDVQGIANIVWDKPETGQFDSYNVAVYSISLENELELIASTNSYNSKYIVTTSSDLVPGQSFVCYVRSSFQGKLSTSLLYTGNTQPVPPIFTSFQNVTKRSVDTVILTLFWEQHFSEFIDHFDLSYAAHLEEATWSSATLSPSLQSYQVADLFPLTGYSFVMEAVAKGKKSYPEIEFVTTGDTSVFNMEVYRLNSNRILIEWDISNLCHKYEVSVVIAGPIVGENTGCDAGEIFIPVVFCNDYIRAYQKLFTTEVDINKLGCVYQVNVDLYKLGEISSSLRLEKKYEHPTILTQLSVNFTSANESTINMEWNWPSLDQLVDRFLVNIESTNPNLFFQKSEYIYSNQHEFNGLLPGTLYNVTILPVRESDTGVPTWSLVWTPLLNEPDVYHWTSWVVYEECSKPCGNGTVTRTRSCLDPVGHIVDRCGNKSHEMMEESCNVDACVIDGGWSNWSQYSLCSATCGALGKKERSRNCSNPEPSNGGKTCIGDQNEKTACPEFSCPAYGSWGVWFSTVPCSPYCGNGTHLRQRNCVTWDNSTTCIGESEELVFCNQGDCPVDGQWSAWQPWSPCTIPCGVTNVTRTRRCDSPVPSNGGKLCQGHHEIEQMETGTCVASLPCPGSDVWSQWGHFELCTATCGPNAIQTRTRGCEWKEEEFRGVFPCLRTEQETFSCGLIDCPINGSWGVWERWSPCSVSCGTGVRYRTILCNQPSPQYGGQPCAGSVTGSRNEVEDCVEDKCPPDRYRSAQWSVLRCNTKTTSTTRWQWEYAGSTQNGSCPEGQVGVARRKCSQFGNWLDEDFSLCQLNVLNEIESETNSLLPNSSNFLITTNRMLGILSNDFNGRGLKTTGDILAVKRILSKLLSWEPFLFPDVTRSEKLDYISAFSSTFERLLNHQYNWLWRKLETGVLLENLKDFMRIIDVAASSTANNLDKSRFHKYETGASNNLNLLVESLPSLGESVKYPDQESSSFRYDKSHIELPTNVIPPGQQNDNVQIIFTKYEDPNSDLSSLPLNSLLNGGTGYGGRKLNSALVGAKLVVNGREQHRLRQHVYVTFYHKRKSKDHVCTFVDLKSSASFFNDDGCEIWRKRDDFTICRCNHLTTFALLSHDVVDEEYKYELRKAEYNNYMSILSYVCIGLLVFAFTILLFPGSISFQGAFLINSYIFSVVIRHSSVMLPIMMSLSPLTCLFAGSILCYGSLAALLWSQLRIFNVEARLREFEHLKKQTGLFGASTWIISMTSPASLVAVYVLYDGEMSCDLLFSPLVLLPGICMCAVAVLCSFGLLIFTTRDFYASYMSLKPIIAKRLEIDLWLSGSGLFFTIMATGLTHLLFLQTMTPSFLLQIIYSVAVLFEVVIVYVNIWKNQELRAFYHKFFGASPPVQSVVYKPPKYVP